MKGVLPNFTTNPILYWDSVTGGKEYPTFIGGAANWILNGHTEEEYKGLAKFIEFMGSPEMDLYYHNMTGYSAVTKGCLLYTSPSPRDKRQSRMPSSA